MSTMEERVSAQARAEPANPHVKRLFFIGGMPKSGTTWLQILLGLHPEISCEGESHIFSSFAKDLIEAALKHNALLNGKNTDVFNERPAYPSFSDADIERLLFTAACALIAKQKRFGTAIVVGEKTPDNVLNLPLIWRIFPSAKFIHVIRDGRDCAVSGWFHNRRTHPQWLDDTYGSFDAFALEMARIWVRNLEAGEQAAASRPDNYCNVRFEDLSADPVAAVAGLLSFLEVDASPSVLRACIDGADFARLSGGRAPGQEDRSSFFRQGKPGNWRNHFSDELNQAFVASAEPWFNRLHYL